MRDRLWDTEVPWEHRGYGGAEKKAKPDSPDKLCLFLGY